MTDKPKPRMRRLKPKRYGIFFRFHRVLHRSTVFPGVFKTRIDAGRASYGCTSLFLPCYIIVDLDTVKKVKHTIYEQI